MAGHPHTVTFDCWSTLLYEPSVAPSRALRAQLLVGAAGTCGVDVSEQAAETALDTAWRRHHARWEAQEASGAREMTRWALDAVGAAASPEQVERLATALEDVALDADVRPLDGAIETLEVLAASGARRALICDTGFSPGRVVRGLLEREGLLDHLEVVVFSDEVGVPKPHPRMFATALDGLGVPAAGAVHVGDLRRTDVAGGRAAGMRTVRISWHNDDRSVHPEADAVAVSHEHLRDILDSR